MSTRAAVRPWPRGARVGDPGDHAAVGSDDVVTAEAVAIEVPAAGLGVRVASGLLDGLCVVGTFVTLTILFSVATIGTDEALFEAASILALVLSFVGAPTLVETLTRGRSVGKLALGLRTVRDDGGPIAFPQAFTRALVGVVETYLLLGAPAFLTALLSPRGKRLGDHAAGTYVARERVQLVLPTPPAMPWPLQEWARTADVAAPPPHLVLAARQFLARAHTLEPRAREVLALQLADRLTAYVAPLPPVTAPPEAFLCAVLATRRERDLDRLGREARLRSRLLQRRRG
ncbi:RDD family protein [Nocardioides sp. ChNu-153]|uniref:RDD family protein n=1 Tax=Nocardioides sp. ChNu-153 TaxID=2779364 RepID=UPI0026569865|nr:RDD family protein [Nocardioides sp. ChNu-153]MDN7120415.1 RDD family protein [Nocardioides sp. ChNu-153]